MTDNAIREIHGVTARTNGERPARLLVTIRESEDAIIMRSDKPCDDTVMTQWQARYLATKLYRLSRRIRQRTE